MSEIELPGVLQVKEVSEGRYQVQHPAEDPEGRNVVFSGQILAQMIMASDHAVEGTKEVKSIHAIFARAGRYTEPMELQRESLHAGRAWGSETLTAWQGDRLAGELHVDNIRAVPEPATLYLLALAGLSGLWFLRRCPGSVT